MTWQSATGAELFSDSAIDISAAPSSTPISRPKWRDLRRGVGPSHCFRRAALSFDAYPKHHVTNSPKPTDLSEKVVRDLEAHGYAVTSWIGSAEHRAVFGELETLPAANSVMPVGRNVDLVTTSCEILPHVHRESIFQ